MKNPLCLCGCGLETKNGARYAGHGHHNTGKKFSPETRRKQSEGLRKARANPLKYQNKRPRHYEEILSVESAEAAAERFWSRVTVAPNDGCWRWQGYCDQRGYGEICIAGDGRATHRVSWLIHFGKIPDGLWVLHKCDNPGCVRPDHLFLGTVLDNNRDKIRKGRDRPQRGEDHYQAKVTADQVREIRRLNQEDGVGRRRLSRRFPLSEGSISDILDRTTWKHVA